MGGIEFELKNRDPIDVSFNVSVRAGGGSGGGGIASAQIDEAIGDVRDNKDAWSKKELPAVTTSDNGKFLRVVNGAWAAVSISDANGVNF